MITKRPSKQNGKIHVTFALPERAGEHLHVLGDFNNWQPTTGMSHGNGVWKTSVDLEPGHRYEFRYLADDARWLNDPEPDAVVSNPYGSENCVVQT